MPSPGRKRGWLANGLEQPGPAEIDELLGRGVVAGVCEEKAVVGPFLVVRGQFFVEGSLARDRHERVEAAMNEEHRLRRKVLDVVQRVDGPCERLEDLRVADLLRPFAGLRSEQIHLLDEHPNVVRPSTDGQNRGNFRSQTGCGEGYVTAHRAAANGDALAVD